MKDFYIKRIFETKPVCVKLNFTEYQNLLTLSESLGKNSSVLIKEGLRALNERYSLEYNGLSLHSDFINDFKDRYETYLNKLKGQDFSYFSMYIITRLEMIDKDVDKACFEVIHACYDDLSPSEQRKLINELKINVNNFKELISTILINYKNEAVGKFISNYKPEDEVYKFFTELVLDLIREPVKYLAIEIKSELETKDMILKKYEDIVKNDAENKFNNFLEDTLSKLIKDGKKDINKDSLRAHPKSQEMYELLLSDCKENFSDDMDEELNDECLLLDSFFNFEAWLPAKKTFKNSYVKISDIGDDLEALQVASEMISVDFSLIEFETEFMEKAKEKIGEDTRDINLICGFLKSVKEKNAKIYNDVCNEYFE